MHAKETSNVYKADMKAGASWIQFREVELWHIPRQSYIEINRNNRHQWQNPHVNQLDRQIKRKNVLFALKIQEVRAFTLYRKTHFWDAVVLLLYFCIDVPKALWGILQGRTVRRVVKAAWCIAHSLEDIKETDEARDTPQVRFNLSTNHW